MPPYLPAEIIVAIIASISYETLRESNRTLLNCALVCRDWLPASRSQLLNFLDLTTSTAYNSLVENVLHSDRLEPCLASTEIVWLTDPSEYDEPPPRGDAARGWTYRFVHDFAGHLPNLESLTIEEADWTTGRPLHPRAHLALSRFSSLKQLSLSDCKLPSAQTMRRMVSALSGSLEELELINVTCPVARGETSATYATRVPGPALNTLHFSCRRGDNDCLAPFLRWLLHTPTRSSLRDLSLRSTRTDVSPHANDYMAFVKTVAPRLAKLTISLTPLGAIPFHLLSSLEDLTLSFGLRSQGHWHTVVRSLPTLPSEARVRHLGFTMWLKGAMQPPDLPGQDQPRSPASIELDGLELLEEALQKARAFRDLESLGINVLGNTSSDTESGAADAEARILADVQQMLPSLALKGIISVGWSGLVHDSKSSPIADTDK